MSYDRIKKYLGDNLFNHISALDANSLRIMKRNIIADMNLHNLGSTMLFQHTIELQYINYLLEE